MIKLRSTAQLRVKTSVLFLRAKEIQTWSLGSHHIHRPIGNLAVLVPEIRVLVETYFPTVPVFLVPYGKASICTATTIGSFSVIRSDLLLQHVCEIALLISDSYAAEWDINAYCRRGGARAWWPGGEM